MTAAEFAALTLFTGVVTMTPGGATALAMASGARFGLRRSAPLIAGIAAGLASLAAFAAAGFGVLLLGIPQLAFALRLLGSCYLAGLALVIARGAGPGAEDGQREPMSFLMGVDLLWLSPKGWAMALAAAAAFAGTTQGPTQLALVLGGSFGLAATLSLSLWSVAGVALARRLRTRSQWRMLNGALALLLALSLIPIWLA